MKQFTVKDFIKYNGPCFSCGSKIEILFQFSTQKKEDKSWITSDLKPTVKNDFIECDLNIKYKSSLQLKIHLLTNKFEVSSVKDLIEWLDKYNLSIQSRCSTCHTDIYSNNLEFNLIKMFIKPFSLKKEKLCVIENISSYLKNGSSYIIDSSFITEKSILHAFKNLENTKTHSLTIEMPLTPLYKLKTREKFLNKMKTYLLFS